MLDRAARAGKRVWNGGNSECGFDSLAERLLGVAMWMAEWECRRNPRETVRDP